MSTRFAHILIFASLSGAAGLVVAPTLADATTGVEVTLPVQVILTDQGVTFTPRKLKLDVDTTLEVKVVKRSSAPRSFRLGFRQTRKLTHGASAFFFFSPTTGGKIAWTSIGSKGKTFTGRTPPVIVGNTF
jgi:hypothetical protein